MKKILFLHALFISFLSYSQTIKDINIVPQPVNMKIENEIAKFHFPIYIYFDKVGNNFSNAKYLQNELIKSFLNDGTNFTFLGKVTPDENGVWKDERKIEQKFNNISGRYVKVIAKNYGVIPAGKPGAGSSAWLFADEIEVE